MESLDEDYPKKTIFTISSTIPNSPLDIVKTNQALAMHSLSQKSNLYLPLSFPDFNNQGNWSRFLNTSVNSLYHYSGYQALVIYYFLKKIGD